MVIDEIAKAEKFKPRLTTLYVATTADNDTKLQQTVRILSDKRVAADKFAVSLLFWDDIVAGLLLNPAVFHAHYPQVALLSASSANRERLIAAFELGYYGGQLWDFVVLTFGEYGLMAQTVPDEFIATLRIIEQRATQLLPRDDATPLLKSLSAVRKGCVSTKKEKSDWDPVEIHAKRIQTRVKKASSLLPLAESNTLDLGVRLASIYFHVDDLPSLEVRSNLERRVRDVLPPSSAVAVRKRFASAKKLTSGYRWAMQIYSLIDHEIRSHLTRFD